MSDCEATQLRAENRLVIVFRLVLSADLLLTGCAGGPQSLPQLRPVQDYADAGDNWIDRSPHRSGFITANGTRLHYLDWGGRGETVVLLAGITMTPHIYDDLAPALAQNFHVLGITRRGHGESERSAGGYTINTLVADLRAVLDSLGIPRAHLVGHSIAGVELTAFALQYPSRVGKLVYLDAAPAQPEVPPRPPMEDPIPEPPKPARWETSRSLLRGWVSAALHRGAWSDAAEANLRARHGRNEKRLREALEPGVADSIFEARATFQADLTAVRNPALGLFSAGPDHPLVNLAPDDSTRRLARKYVEVRILPRNAAVQRLFATLPQHRIVLIPGGIDHYFFITNPSRVLQEIRTFLAGPAR